ncbi:DUF116 domain-containing protein [candidate division KSB1 bacterium]|nr:DUF116 domain-containing protein [candidate division KSB1 bacterium]
MANKGQQQGPPGGRRLGDEWLDWSGKAEENVDSGKRIFLGFATIVMVLISLLSLFAWWLITPRLNMIHPYLSLVVGLLILGFVLALGIWFALMLLSIIIGKDLAFYFGKKKYSLTFLVPIVINLGRRFGISRDRISSSFIKVSNALIRAARRRIRGNKLMILLPRCLQKANRQEILLLAERNDCEVYTVSGGEAARVKIAEIRPTGIIAVACERDLVTGIEDVVSKIPVIAIPNVRPEGPCKNTYTNVSEIEEAIKIFLKK